MISVRSIMLSSALVMSGAANAAPYSQEWRLMGPAFSHHLSDEGRLIKSAEAERQCRVVSVVPVTYECRDVYTKVEHKRWVENNPALGMRYTRRSETSADSLLVNFVRDSYGTPSLMLAAARTWPLIGLGSVSIEAGLVGGLWWRSVLNRSETDLQRRVVPFVLPTITVTENTSGIGLDVAFAPRVSMGGHQVNRTPTFIYQLTYLMSKGGEADESRVGLERSQSGALLATYSRKF